MIADPAQDGLATRIRALRDSGDHAGLAGIGLPEMAAGLAAAPDRADLALTVAAAQALLGQDEAASASLALARDWGCDPGEAAARLLPAARHWLGQARKELGAVATKPPQPAPPSRAHDPGVPPPVPAASPFNPSALAFYSAGVPAPDAAARSRFLFLDSKSLPRAGLHFLSSSLSGLLGDMMSFCEWYQEPGCCRQMPCAITDYASAQDRNRGFALRLTKSHDFALTDPDYPVNAVVRRIIILRDPLFVLTSWWTLDLITRHRQVLRTNHIRPEKLFFRHEKPVLAAAYRLIDSAFDPGGPDELARWLDKAVTYLAGFAEKWARSTESAASPYQQIVLYEDIARYISRLLAEIGELLPAPVQELLDDPEAALTAQFVARQDPFAGPTAVIGAHLTECRTAFRDAAAEVLRRDRAAIFSPGRSLAVP